MNPYLGESMSVIKTNRQRQHYQGTTAASGLAIATITAIGGETKLGTIGKSLEKSRRKNTFRVQIGNFMQKKWLCRSINFLIVWIINF
jgi:Ca2+-transporting ATPase